MKSMILYGFSIEPYFPPQKPNTRGSRSDMRKLMNGILYVVMTGCTWKMSPAAMAPSQQYIDFIFICVRMGYIRDL
jgi:transposase